MGFYNTHLFEQVTLTCIDSLRLPWLGRREHLPSSDLAYLVSHTDFLGRHRLLSLRLHLFAITRK